MGKEDKAAKIFQTEEAEGIMRKMLNEEGFDEKAPDVKAAWNSFKKMCEVEFDCAGDDLLFETGMYEFSGEKEFFLSFVRQFTVDVDGEYDYMKQLHLDFNYKPEQELENLKEIVWTFDFEDDFEQFFKAVEENAVFLNLQEHYKPIGCELFMEEI